MSYAHRMKDLNAKRLVYNEDGSIEAYGEMLDGTTAWIWIHVTPDTTVEHIAKPQPVEYETRYIPHAHTGQPVRVRVPKPINQGE